MVIYPILGKHCLDGACSIYPFFAMIFPELLFCNDLSLHSSWWLLHSYS